MLQRDFAQADTGNRIREHAAHREQNPGARCADRRLPQAFVSGAGPVIVLEGREHIWITEILAASETIL